MTVIIILAGLALVVYFAIKLMQKQAEEEVHILGGLRNIFDTLNNALLELGFKMEISQSRRLAYTRLVNKGICEVEITKNLNPSEPYWLCSYFKKDNAVTKSIPFIISPDLSYDKYKEIIILQLVSIGVNSEAALQINKIQNSKSTPENNKNSFERSYISRIQWEKQYHNNISNRIDTIIRCIKKDTPKDLIKAKEYFEELILYCNPENFEKHEMIFYGIAYIVYSKLNDETNLGLTRYDIHIFCSLKYQNNLKLLLASDSLFYQSLTKLADYGFEEYKHELIDDLLFHTDSESIYDTEDQKLMISFFYQSGIYYAKANKTAEALKRFTYAIKHLERIKITITDNSFFECYRARADVHKILNQNEKANEDFMRYRELIINHEMNTPGS